MKFAAWSTMAIHHPSSRSQCSQKGRGGRSAALRTTAPPTRGSLAGFSFGFSPAEDVNSFSAMAKTSAPAPPREILTFNVHVTTSCSTIICSPSVSMVPSRMSALGTNTRCASTSATCILESPAARSASARLCGPGTCAKSPIDRTPPFFAKSPAVFSSTCGSCNRLTALSFPASAEPSSRRVLGATACVTHCENSRSESTGFAYAYPVWFTGARKTFTASANKVGNSFITCFKSGLRVSLTSCVFREACASKSACALIIAGCLFTNRGSLASTSPRSALSNFLTGSSCCCFTGIWTYSDATDNTRAAFITPRCGFLSVWK
mmetsp:Transcript_13179/g.43672  ORF Transcript_13179/g.43672 Transcript_13179/m.43672 type:complete len:321 (+) Transcript_13179:803-1765(+)